MLKKGLIPLELAWYEVLWGILPFASLFLKAASRHHHGGVSPTVVQFMQILPSLSWRCPATGRPLLGKSFVVVQRFVADTSALGITFNVRDVLLALVKSLVRIWYGKDAAWDRFTCGCSNCCDRTRTPPSLHSPHSMS